MEEAAAQAGKSPYTQLVNRFVRMYGPDEDPGPFLPDPGAVWRLGVCRERAGDLAEAVRFFRRVAAGEGLAGDGYVPLVPMPGNTGWEKPARRMDAENVELVCLAGYMRILSDVLLKAYEGRIINIHPSLLPAFRGAHAVEQAVEYGVKVYGITIHYVNAELDGGKIIAQKAFEYEGDDPAEVHRIGQKIEHRLYIDTINKLLRK